MPGFLENTACTAKPLTREGFERLVNAPQPKPLPVVIVFSAPFVARVRERWPEMFR